MEAAVKFLLGGSLAISSTGNPRAGVERAMNSVLAFMVNVIG